jgi:hypothetical protein
MTKNYDFVEARLRLVSTLSSVKQITSYITKKRTSSSFLIVLVALFSFSITNAQSTANYAFSTNTTGSLAIDANGNTIDMTTGTTQLVAADIDDTSSSGTSIGFNFPFFGSQFTQFYATSNGVVQLGSSAPSSTLYVLSGGSVASPRLGAFVADLRTGALGKVHYKMVGTAPNRCLVVEFLNMSLTYVGSPGSNDGTYQVRLYESSGIIEYIYGSMFKNASTTTAAAIYAGFSVGSIINTTASITTASNSVSNGATFNLNSYTNSTNIPNLHSSADGSRRIYSFTPLSVVSGDVTNLTFNTVTPNSTTLNWTDNATNEYGFLVTRATDAAFTQNVSTATVASTTSAGTGTDYSSIQTGLSSGTNYFYKVVALVEVGQSVGINGNQSTLNAETYYWIGATGDAWNTFANWNTSSDGTGAIPTAWANSDIHVLDGAGTTPGGDLSISVDRANFTVGQIKITNSTNLTLSSSATTTRTITISGGPSEDFILENGSTLNLTSATNAVAFAFTGSGNTGTIAGTYIASGSTTNVITSTGGTGTLLTVTSTGSITSNLNSSSAGIVGSIATLLFENGSNYIHSNSTTVNYIPAATWQPNATATLNGNTTGTSLTSNSTSLGNLIVNNTLSTATLSAFTTSSRIIQGNLTVNSTGTGRFRAVTSGVLQINGNLIVNAGIFDVGNGSAGGVIVKGNTTVQNGATLDVNQSTLQNEGNMVNNGAVLSSETTTANSRLNFIGTTIPQTFSGTGTFTGRVSSLGVSNPSGLILTTPVLTQRVNLFSGTITGSSNITIGTGLALAATVQIGLASNPNSGGNFDVSPIYNLGTGTYSLLYLGETTPRTTGFEVPPTRSVNNLTIDNANGLNIAGGTIEVLNGLTLTNGIISTSTANHIIHGSSTAAGTLTGGSLASHINGPIVRTINDANLASNYVLYPVGKLGVYTPIWLAPTTTAASKFRAETFDTNTGTSDASIIDLSTTRRWEAILDSGTFTDINVRLGEAALVSTNIPVQAPTASGAYSSAFGSLATFTAGTPNTVQSNFSVASSNYTGFISYANSNACSGTPTPGNTIASSNSICLGESVTLSLQNITNGSGVAYQWQSSSDGISYTDISSANGVTLTVTPTVSTYYRCNVTCTTGPATGTSTGVQVTFSNSVTATIPATRCGLGIVTLEATPSTGANIKWFAAATGGEPIASGNSFTTPSISATTTYFASAETSTSGSVTIGQATTLTGATTQPSAFVNRWPSYRIQTLYTAAELNAAGLTAGNITSMSYFTTTLGDGATNANFTVKIGNSSQTSMTTTWVPTTSFSTVYGPVTHTHTASGEQPINFTTPFNWDGVSNIVIEVMYNGADITNNAITFFTATSNNMVVHSNTSGSATATGTVTTNRLNLKINGQVACQSGRVPVVATVTSPPALTLNTTTATICESTPTPTVTLTSNPLDYNTYVWSPSTGVTGNETTGWTFSPSTSTNYTLTATQTAGSLCVTTTSYSVTVNPRPSVMTITPTTGSVCIDNVQSLVVSGGTIGSSGIGTLGTDNAPTKINVVGVPYRTGTTVNFEVRSQYLISASELNASGITAGDLTSLAFIVTNNPTGTMSNLVFNIGATTSTALTTSYLTPTFTNVLTLPTYSPVSGNNLHTFTTPYTWDGVSNIVVQICGTLTTGGSGCTMATTTTSTITTLGNASSTGCTTATGSTVTNARPVMVFGFTNSVPTTITWSPVTNLYSDATATVNYIAGTNATTVYYKSSSANTNTYTATSTSSANCSTSADVTVTTLDCGIQYANLQFPGSATINPCGTQVFYAQVYKAGVTEGAGQGAGITAWIGTNTSNTDPATWPESSWQLATFNVQVGNNDEYQASFGPLSAGTYYVASRFVFTPGNYVYGGYTSSGGGFWNGTSNISAVLTVDSIATPTAAAQTFCNSATVADLVATGTDLQWYVDATGGTALASTTALASGNYYVSQTLNSCESARTMVSVTVNVTAAPTAAAQTFCNSATVADLVATGTDLQWYADATGGTALASTTALASGNYYVSQTLNSCESARTMVSVTVNVTAAPTAAAQSFCNSATVADLVATGTDLQWYADATGGTALASTTALASGNYYVSQTLNSCESTRTMVSVTVNITAAPTASAQIFCNSATVADLVATGTDLQWYADATGGTALASTTVLASGNYYVSQTLNSCESTRTMVSVTVNVTAAPTATAQSFCNGATVADLVATGTDLQWYADATGGTALASTTALASGNYYVSQTLNSCESTRTMVAVAITTASTPTGDALQTINVNSASEATIEDIVVSGTGIIWYPTLADANAGTNPIAAGTQLVSGNTYYAVSVVGTCRSSALEVTITVVLDTKSFDIKALKYYPNPVLDKFTVSYSQNITSVEVYDLSGRIVKQNKVNSTETTIDMSELAASVYVVKVFTENQSGEFKIIKK